jgi:pleiotropic regulator 1
LFGSGSAALPEGHEESAAVKRKAKLLSSFTPSKRTMLTAQMGAMGSMAKAQAQPGLLTNGPSSGTVFHAYDTDGAAPSQSSGSSQALVTSATTETPSSSSSSSSSSGGLVIRKAPTGEVPHPKWHAPWELSAVLAGHQGWVRSVAFDPLNEWFVTGSADRTIKIWDFAKCAAGAEGGLKLTLTGHVGPVRGLAVSDKHPYLFSAGEDKQVKCWDLEYNRVIRHYHGHLSGVYCMSLHPTLDLLVTAGRDSVARVWDMRTKQEVHVLGGHSNTVASVLTYPVDPQIVTSSYDCTVKLWDLVAGRSMTTMTQHKKAVRALAATPHEMTFLSGGKDNIKKWQVRDGKFLQNFSGHEAVVNSLAVNADGVAISGADDGSMRMWDYDTGHCFQQTETIVQPGSLKVEGGIFASAFDHSGSRLVTCEADKSIKIWKENATASEDTHPIDMDAWTKHSLSLKRY